MYITVATVPSALAQTGSNFCETTPTDDFSNSSGLSLRILAMGASIVWGHSSFDGNGFRLGVQNLLQQNGTNVTMIGTQYSGDMTENHHEAYEGNKITELNNHTYHSGGYELDGGPNVVLVHVGTNDCWWVSKENGTGAAERMGYLLDSIHAKVPNALVLQSEVIRSTADAQDVCLRGINAGLPAIVEQQQAKGQIVRLVSMYDAVPVDQMSGDATHPTDEGYQSMARQWYQGAVDAVNELCTPDKVGERQQAAESSSSAAAASSSSVASVAAASSESVAEAEASSSAALQQAQETSTPASVSASATGSAVVGGSTQFASPTTAASGASNVAAGSWFAGVLACMVVLAV
ncbi:hypothetical protein LTR95_012938 [Oleoguttula sp. CCFEE 5521]